MRKLSLYLILCLTFIQLSCKKDKQEDPYNCTACTKTPEAAAANDASSKGIYKGVVIGSTGTIKFDVQNNGTAITAVLTIDGQTVNLVSNVTWTNGQPYVAPFTGTLNGQPVSITFSVGLSGQTPTVTSASIPGHPNATFTVFKETSSSLIKCWEGTYTGTDAGTLNIISAEGIGWKGIARKNGSSSSSDFGGTMSGNTVNCSCSPGTTVTGTISGDNITGQWNDGSGSGTWNARRTL